MRKKLLLLSAAMFTIFQASTAQTLYSSKALQCEKANGEKTLSPARVASKAESSADSVGYWVDANSYYDANGSFSLTNGEKKSYRANLIFNGNQVTFTSLFDTSDWYGISSYYDITGTYDAAKKTITIKTPSYKNGANASHYTLFGKMSYYGTECFIALLAGEFSSTPDAQGQYGLSMTDSLVFDVSDNLTTLTPRTGFGLWAFSEEDGSSVGSLMFFKKSSRLNKMPEEAQLAVEPDTITFEGPSVTVGATLKRTYTLVNKGLKEANVTASVNADGMQVAVPRNIGAGSKVSAYVIFKPKTTGDYTGDAVLYGNNGATSAQLNFKATVKPAPDFSQVVRQGSSNINFSLGNNYPFVVTDTITGYPVAVSTNKGSNTQAQLYANFDVPAGKVGVFSWKGIKEGSYGNGVKIYLNGDSTITDDSYTHGMDVSSFKDDISNMLVLKEGSYVVEYNNELMNDWNNTGDKTLRTYLHDFNLQLADVAEHAAMLKVDSLDFGSHYYDNLSVRDTLTANLMNLGTKPLKVTSIEGDGTFGGVVPENVAPSFTTLPVIITYEAKNVGEHAGKVVIKTNAGDYTVSCKARNEAIPANYQAIVKSGNFSFNTSDPYPFAVLTDTAYNSTAGMDNNNTNSFLEANFEVPEGKVGKLSWKAINNSFEYFYFMNDTIMTTGTRITIDGGLQKEFAGNGTDASSTNWTDEQLTFAPGLHTLRFFYKKGDSTPKYEDKIKVYDLALNLTTGIAQINTEKGEVVRTEIYNLSGQAQSQLQRGINIVKRIYVDGSTTTSKILIE